MDPTPTLQAVRGWPVEDRLELVFRLWDQLTTSSVAEAHR
jgi:hypothetical protein